MIENKFISESSEVAFLSCIIKDENCLLSAIEFFKKDSLGNEYSNIIYNTILDILEEGNKLLPELLISRLDEDTNKYLEIVKKHKVDISNFEYYTRIVKDKYLFRSYNKLSNTIKSDVQTIEKTEDLVQHIQDKIDEINISTPNQTVSFGQNLFDIIPDPMSMDESHQGKILGISSGIKTLDDIVLGFHGGCFTTVAGRPSEGKALWVEELVLTNSGFKKMGELSYNDLVYGGDGKLHNITGIFPQGVKKLFKVTFKDNTSVICSEDHLWTVSSRNSRGKYGKESYIVRDTKYINEHLTRDNGKRLNFSIPYTNPIEFDKKELLIHPYLLGVLIGDGCFRNSTTISFYNEEFDIVDKCKNLLPESCAIVTYKTSHIRNSIINKIRSKQPTEIYLALKKYNLDNKYSYQKSIPTCYLNSSIDDRIELLRGLMDTDGYTNHGTTLIYCTTSHKLLNNIMFLIRSLGGFCTFVKNKGSYKKDGKYISVKYYYKIYFTFSNGIVPVSSKKHLALYTGLKRKTDKFIKNIEYFKDDLCQCIMIDSEDHTFITNEFNVTHNSNLVRNILLHNALQNIPVLLFSMDENEQLVKLKTISTITQIDYNHLKKQELTKGEMNVLRENLELFKSLPFFIDTTSFLNVSLIRARIKKLLYKHKNLGAVAIDYIQQMGVTTEEITKVSQGIKHLCQEFKIPFFVISQLSRNIENRTVDNNENWTTPPMLSDLRQSGEIESASDKVIFVRAEPKKDENKMFKEKRKCRIFVQKQRDGVAGVWFDLNNIGKIQTFEEINNDKEMEQLPF